MQKLQSLIQDILDNRNGASSISFFTLNGSPTLNVNRFENDPNPNAFTITIYIGDNVNFKLFYFEDGKVNHVQKQTPLNKMSYNFTPAIVEATKLWNEYKSNNL